MSTISGQGVWIPSKILGLHVLSLIRPRIQLSRELLPEFRHFSSFYVEKFNSLADAKINSPNILSIPMIFRIIDSN